MTGASMPFSLSKYVGMSGSYWPVYRRILRRVFLLFIFGMIVQGNLLGLDSSHIYLYLRGEKRCVSKFGRSENI